MALVIPADVQQRVNALFGTGRYGSEEEILRAAVAALEEQNANLAAIQGGIRDLESGRYRPFADFDAEFRERNQNSERRMSFRVVTTEQAEREMLS